MVNFVPKIYSFCSLHDVLTGLSCSGEALQTVLMLFSAKDIYHTHKANKGMSISQWSVEKADEVLKEWQRAFTKVTNSICIEIMYTMAKCLLQGCSSPAANIRILYI